MKSRKRSERKDVVNLVHWLTADFSKILPARELAEMQMEGDWAPKPDDNESGTRFGWIGMNGTIMIRVDREGRVTDRMFAKLKPLGLFDQLRWIVATRM